MLGRGTGTPPPCNFADAKLWRGRLSSFARPKESTSNGDAGGPAVPEATALRRPAREDLRERRGVEGQARGEYYEELRGRGGCLGKGCTTTSEGEYLSSHSRVPLLCCSNGTNSRVTHTQAILQRGAGLAICNRYKAARWQHFLRESASGLQETRERYPPTL